MFKRCALTMVLTPLVMVVLGLVLAILGPNFVHQRPTTSAQAADDRVKERPERVPE